MKTQQWHPQVKHKTGEIAGPGLTKGCGQVVFGGRMMDYMTCPEKTYLMTATVEPVITQVIRKKAQYLGPPSKAQLQDPELV